MRAPFTCRHRAFPEAEKSPTLPAPARAHAGPERTPVPARGRTGRGRDRHAVGAREAAALTRHDEPPRAGGEAHQLAHQRAYEVDAGPGAIDGPRTLRVFADEPNGAGHLVGTARWEMRDAVRALTESTSQRGIRRPIPNGSQPATRCPNRAKSHNSPKRRRLDDEAGTRNRPIENPEPRDPTAPAARGRPLPYRVGEVELLPAGQPGDPSTGRPRDGLGVAETREITPPGIHHARSGEQRPCPRTTGDLRHMPRLEWHPPTHTRRPRPQRFRGSRQREDHQGIGRGRRRCTALRVIALRGRSGRFGPPFWAGTYLRLSRLRLARERPAARGRGAPSGVSRHPAR